MEKRKIVLLIDSNALVHRAYHALPIGMSTRSGEQTNAIYGFVAALLHALETIKPASVICCFDVKGGTFRHEAYDQYKAHRKEMDDALANQLPRIYAVIEAFGIPISSKTGYEADDCLGTLAKQYEKTHNVIILTGDKDELQLISTYTRVMMMKQGVKESLLYDLKALHDQYGLTPEEFIVFKALRGDPSDNIPGVSGVGEVTALKLVQEYHTLEVLYKALEEPEDKHPLLKGKLRERLLTDKDNAFLSEKLSTIDLNVPLDEIPTIDGGLKLDIATLTRLFDELEFRSFGSRIAKITNSELDLGDIDQKSDTTARITPEAEFIKMLHQSRHEECAITLAYEKHDLDVTMRFVALALPHSTTVATWSPQVQEALKVSFENKMSVRTVWDGKLLMHLIPGLSLSAQVIDLMLIETLLQHNMTEMGNVVVKKETDGEVASLLQARAEALLEHTKTDVTELDHAKMKAVWEVIEQPLISVIARVEDNGVKIDEQFLHQLSRRTGDELAKLEKQIWHEAGQEFNVASPQQLSTILFEKLHIASGGVKKKATGLSTDAATLEALKEVHPIINMILQYRELSKLKGTYIDALPKLVNPRDARVHTTYSQIGAATGRLSSNDPNLQNIPIRTEAGNEIRKSFIAEKGKVLVSLDYSQFELRIMAHLSGDEEMRKSFREHIDIHTATAAKLHGVDTDKVTKEMRRAAKAVNFGILYGLSAHSLAKQLGVDYKQAQDFINRYFASYPKVKEYLARVIDESRTKGCYYTLFGRRRLFPELSSPIWSVRQAGERMAMNFPMQGTQADILKIAMIKVGEHYQNDQNVRMILSVHDELVFEVDEKKAPEAIKTIQNIMQSACELSVPVEVSTRIGTNWGEMKEVA